MIEQQSDTAKVFVEEDTKQTPAPQQESVVETCRRKIQEKMDQMAKLRDELRDLHDELASVVDSMDSAVDSMQEAMFALEQASDSMSQFV
jgi:uncharacterized coiled-coil protein SlyX